MSGISHEWNGTVLTITSDSGTSSMDLKGDKGDDGCRGAQGVPGIYGFVNFDDLTEDQKQGLLNDFAVIANGAYADAVTTTKSGIGYLELDNISPNPHNVQITLTRATGSIVQIIANGKLVATLQPQEPVYEYELYTDGAEHIEIESINNEETIIKATYNMITNAAFEEWTEYLDRIAETARVAAQTAADDATAHIDENINNALLAQREDIVADVIAALPDGDEVSY